MSLPLPSTAINDAPNDLQTGSRKRQRSLSMQSDSSSPKRSASEDPTQDSQKDINDRLARPSPLPSEPTPVLEDSPMDDGPISSQDVSMTSSPLLPVDPSTIDPIITRPLQIGETWYIVHKRWIDRWRKAFSGQEDKEEGFITEATLGPPDKENHNLLDERHILREDVTGEIVDFVPEEVWDRFVSHYGTVDHSLPRKVIARGAIQQPTIEMHPLILKVIRVADPSSPAAGPFVQRITISAAATVKELYKTIHALFNDSDTPFRVWSVTDAPEDALYEVSKLKEGNPNSKLWSETDDLLEHGYVESGDSFAVEFQKDGQWPSNTVPQNHAPAPLFGTGRDFFGKMQAKSPGSKTDDAKPVATTSSSSKLSLWKSSTPTSSKRTTEPGTLGLGNMGNTCFMNSALQCLAHTKELCQYFVSGVFEGELNPDNPLGMQGAIAESFGALLRRIWSDSSTTTSYSPREFKQALQRFAPQFIGYQQHDSQELVAFLLDGLHEDLNRILKKPYIEKPDWESGGDKELVELANLSWEGYLKRNDSVIVDLFQGQYESTLVCPECEKVSITFDPFMYLTLPLPVNKKWTGSIYYMPWDTTEPVLKIPVELPRDASFKELRKLLGRWMEVPPDNLLTLEVFNNRFYKSLDDYVLVSETSENDVLVCYELPCHAQQARSYKRDPDDPYIVPLYRVDAAPTRLTYGRGTPSYFGYPLIVVIDQETAKSKDAIYGAVIERLERGATSPRDLYTWEGAPASDSTIEEVSITLHEASPINSVTEIKPNGEVVRVQETPEEGDIADEKSMVVEEVQPTPEIDAEPKKVGPQANIFVLQLQYNSKLFSPGFGQSGRYESWAKREQDATVDEEDGSLLREGDTFVCEFDEHMKGFFFGDPPPSESFLWKGSQLYTHPEYLEAKKGEAARMNRGITLQDCLEEFTKEEKLGEDDLWYCPRCKKHQQATKRFDLWKLPEILVVHLKRFSNSRILRDKIDTFVDFPIEGLDLEEMVGERGAAKRLQSEGFDISSLGLGDVDEPLVYDLYAVDEHLGGLGGGHYRAYALNHVTKKWYHFDDSFVTESTAEQSVNANAYLLFYRRRSNHPLGGKTYEKIASSGLQTDGVWTGPGPETKSIVPKYATVRPASPEQTEKQGGLFDHMTHFNDSSSHQPWTTDSPRSSPPALEDQPIIELTSTGYVDFLDPEEADHGGFIIHSNPQTPPSDGGYKEGTMTQESVDRWTRSLTTKFTEDNSDSVRPSPPSSSNGDEVNPFQIPDEEGMELVSVEITEVSMDHTGLNDIDL